MYMLYMCYVYIFINVTRGLSIIYDDDHNKQAIIIVGFWWLHKFIINIDYYQM